MPSSRAAALKMVNQQANLGAIWLTLWIGDLLGALVN
jgi:hypothetical protein